MDERICSPEIMGITANIHTRDGIYDIFMKKPSFFP